MHKDVHESKLSEVLMILSRMAKIQCAHIVALPRVRWLDVISVAGVCLNEGRMAKHTHLEGDSGWGISNALVCMGDVLVTRLPCGLIYQIIQYWQGMTVMLQRRTANKIGDYHVVCCAGAHRHRGKYPDSV